ncbi:LytTR family DNA-binding domain-containing protein [Dyadobacter chenwenxiniae]|uniref:LytTR family DNA-binding domain-containing protein n=1 Tax=Dyadobacter chenwenxiniae TaxID=2906456 RepID=A0A9X1PKP2_9BACT|nr:LytTR family DNA-binding domain-containing protein [Dyadobacter chenwenxiniae]MCF0049213.1 LytTR family DNA-binding domain-containing protein [Dyadobacter chenwenxiniae]MCF0061724.1 LytTR family DNA-binding domain-containing protein [Dyadobacter chenwenxiniae]UON81542.1 LytTR family DNA-binding domain-containing protein [Dyadobacter chenwenxiniae]
MNILIVEDEKLAVRKLTKLLEETAPEFVIKGITPSIEATVEWISENRKNGNPEPDIVFLDIELADGQSFEIFNRIEIRSTVIFTTSYDEYALQAFKVNSIDYLLKPVQQEDLQRSIKKFYDLTGSQRKSEIPTLPANLENILKNLQLQQPASDYRKRFLVKQGARMLSVEISEIAYFYIEDGVSFFKNLQGQKFVVDYRMDEMELFLDPDRFFRINRGLIVTHQSVTHIQPYYNNRLALTLKPAFDKESIVSREKTNDFKKWMGK